MDPSCNCLLVAAIDFGTTYSGYAFSFKDEFQRDRLKIHTNYWNAGTEGLLTLKAPTSVLYSTDGTFHSFGFDAENVYVDLLEEEKADDWMFFRRFKMQLYDQRLRRNMKLKDTRGKEKKAMDVFADTIRFLTEKLVKEIKDKVPGIEFGDIFFVLTVPAIWDDEAKQFMRECAAQAGVPEKQLAIALEPEAAAIYCKESSVQRQESSEGASLVPFPPGKQFMIVDLGGGTADITVFRIKEDGSLEEMFPASGGPWGGTYVDREFDFFLSDVFGEEVMAQFRNDPEASREHLEMVRTFEVKKRQIQTTQSKVNFRIPPPLAEMFRSFHRQPPEFSMEGIECKRNRLSIQEDIFKRMFHEVLKSLLEHISSMFKQKELQSVDTILVVGGFSESRFVKEAIKETFTDKTVMIPTEGGLAVLKGAVIYGHDPYTIHSRVSRYTYGINTHVPFDDRKHPEGFKITYHGEKRCDGIFRPFLQKGRTIIPGRTSEKLTCRPHSRTADKAYIEIYRSELQEPLYTFGENVKKIGEVAINLTQNGFDEENLLDVEFLFGYTELRVRAQQKGSNATVGAHFDFLR